MSAIISCPEATHHFGQIRMPGLPLKTNASAPEPRRKPPPTYAGGGLSLRCADQPGATVAGAPVTSDPPHAGLDRAVHAIDRAGPHEDEPRLPPRTRTGQGDGLPA